MVFGNLFRDKKKDLSKKIAEAILCNKAKSLPAAVTGRHNMSVRKLMAAAALGGGVALAPIAASAADFSGKTVTIIVPFKEGGGAAVS